MEEEEEDEDEEDEEEQLEAHKLPEMLHSVPQFLQDSTALHSRYDADYGDGANGEEFEIQRERRGELRLDSQIGTTCDNKSNEYFMFETSIMKRKIDSSIISSQCV